MKKLTPNQRIYRAIHNLIQSDEISPEIKLNKIDSMLEVLYILEIKEDLE